MSIPSVWTVTGLLDYFQEIEDTPDRRFAFILGAGASVQSGIPMAGHLVDSWLRELHTREDHERRPLAQWASAATLGIPGFEYERAVESYSQVFARRFAGRPDEGHAYLERILHGRDPSFGYSVLAQILANTRHRVVITTNFDNLVADALAIYTHQLPFVCGHESLAGFVRPNPRRPLVVKIHRDLLLAPKNTSDEIAALPDPLVSSLRGLLAGFTPIVVGYGGNDGSLMGLLRETLQPGDIPGGIYWCYWAGSGLPGPAITEVVQRHGGALIPIAGFDELMVQLNHRLGYPRMDQRIEQRARERAQRYRQSFEALHQRVLQTEVVLASDDFEVDADDAEATEEASADTPALATTRARVSPPTQLDRAPSGGASGARDGAVDREPRPATRGAASSEPVLSSRSAARADERGATLRSAAPAPPAPPRRPSQSAPATQATPPPDPPTASAAPATAKSAPPTSPVILESASAVDTPVSFADVMRGLADPDVDAETLDDLPRPAREPDAATTALQQAVQALVGDSPAGPDWWTLKLHADQQPTPATRITAYREAVARFPDNATLLRGLACQLALANVRGEARELYWRLEQWTPDDPQIHLDLAVLFFRWGAGKTRSEPYASTAWHLARAQGQDPSMLAAIALVRGLLARFLARDDTTALRVLRGLLPVVAGPLQDFAGLLETTARKHLDMPAYRLYQRLLLCLHGLADVQMLKAIDRWNTLTPLAPEAAWPDDRAVPGDSSLE